LTVESLASKKCEGPTEQKANLFLCSHAFIDDFSPWEPLNNVVLRQFSGGNMITAARKNQPELVFRFAGQVYLLCNDAWTPKEPFIGADVRRHHGLTFNVKFVDAAPGPNELLKDNNIKNNIRNYFAEFWFVARVFWLATKAHATSDHTLPFCANTFGVVRALMDKNGGNAMPRVSEAGAELAATISSRALVKPWVLGAKMPDSAATIDAEICRILALTTDQTTLVRIAMKTMYVYKNWNVPAVGGRKRTSINAYVNGRIIMTLA
jgi:hypothetical protein